HQTHNAPRREGAPRNGRGDEGHRGGGRPKQDGAKVRSHGDRPYAERPNNGSAHARNGRSDQSSPANGHVEGKAIFGVASRQDRPSPGNSHRGERRTSDQRGHSERPAEHRSGEHRPARRADGHRTGAAHGRHRDGETGVRREAGNAPMKRHTERAGDSRTSWSGTDAPKFLRRREDDRVRTGPDRNPTS